MRSSPLLGCYTVQIASYLPNWTAGHLKMGLLVCSKLSASYYHSTPHNIPEEWKSQLLFCIVITLEHMQHVNYRHLKYFLLVITYSLHSNVWVDFALLFMFSISVQWNWEMSLHSIWTVMWQRSVNHLLSHVTLQMLVAYQLVTIWWHYQCREYM